LRDVADRLDAIDGVAVIRMNAEDVVRHPLVAEMLSVL
jgi:phosphate starvation-inducible PhoH-like protein